MSLKVNRLTNANVYLNGNNLLGQAAEINLPEIKHMMSEHQALGMVGKVELFAGIDKMEAKIKWNSFYADTIKSVANPTVALQLQCRGNVETYEAAGRTDQKAAVCYFTGFAKNIPTGNFKQHDNVELETMFTVTYVKLEIGAVVLYELDVLSNTFKVNGVDILADYKANIGA